MNSKTIRNLVLLLPFTVIISCSGSPEKKKDGGKVPVTNESIIPSKRLIEVLAPADNAIVSCADRLTFSVVRAGGADRVDSVQLWFGSEKIATVTSLPAAADIPVRGMPGRKSLRAVAFSSSSKPQTVALFLTMVSDIDPVIYRYKIVRSFPHDRKAWTQGLVYDNGFFYEGTGQPGESSLRKVEVETGKITSQVNLESSLFGEGIALLGERIYQLTWTSRVGFVYDKASFTQVNKIYYQTEGWGLTTTGDTLVMSDGTNMIWLMDQDFNVLGSVEVWDNKGKVDSLNELEMINGELWANIWQTDNIARIDLRTGKVLGYLQLNNMLSREDRTPETDVLNGIAWDSVKNRLFVTGKYWPKMFEITLVAQGRN